MSKRDLEDVAFIREEFARFAAMGFRQYMRHVEEYPDDKMQSIQMPEGGHRPIGKAASLRFWQLAERRLQRETDAAGIDVATLQALIRREFIDAFIAQKKPVEQKFVDRMLHKAVKAARLKHRVITHYIPCVIMTDASPPQFSIGPIRFLTRSLFYEQFRAQIEADYLEQNAEQDKKLEQLIAEGKYHRKDVPNAEESARIDQLTLESIFGYYDSFVWIAEVRVPACEPKVSRQRANQATQAALDVLKLFFGHHGAVDFRLAHDRGKPHRTAHLTRREDGVFHWEIGRQGEGAFVKSGWYERMQSESSWALEAAGSAIEAYLTPSVESEHRDRWLGALTWYGQATRDQLPAGQLVKYVAALERLTVTDHTPINGVTDTVTRRTALLSVSEYSEDVLTKARTDARTIYKWRSNLMHGRSSPLTKELASVMHLAYRTAQQALFVALHLLVNLEASGRRTGRDLEDRYLELERELPPQEKARNAFVAELERLSYRLRAAGTRIRGRERSLVMRAAAASRKLAAKLE